MTTFSQNVVVCPQCGTSIVHNKVNGVALVEAIGHIAARKKMYSRLSLDALERAAENGNLNFPLIRKTILDNFSDFSRDVETILGWGNEAE